METQEWQYGDFDWEAAESATSHFVNMEDTKMVLKMALIGSVVNPLYKNVILWGQGGFGKSDFTSTFIEAACKGNSPFVMSHHKESSTAEENGGIDLVALSNGKLKYNVESSWMNSQVAILEEAFDAPDTLLLSLKDTITRRQFTIGENFAVKTRLIIINTNHSPDKFQGDLSKAAFLERFPIIQRVDWNNLTISARVQAYKTIVKAHNMDNSRNPMTRSVQSTLSSIAASELWSPRRVIQVIQTCQDFVAANNGGLYNNNVGQSEFMDVARMMKFDTADMLEQLAADERQESIRKFEEGLNLVLDGYKKKFMELSETKISDLDDVILLGKKIKSNVDRLDEITARCNTIRGEFGEDSHAVVDRLLRNVEDIKGDAQLIWNDAIFS